MEVHPEIMIPLVGFLPELKTQARIVRDTADRVFAEKGIKVDYQEVIQDNNEFFAKIRPLLQAGQPTGYDLMVMTSNSPVLSALFDSGWVIPIDHRKMTNFNKYASDLAKSPAWDPGNKYSMAWQSGYTALAYNTDMIKEDITSVQSLFDSKYKGKVGMFTDPQELGSLGLLAVGVDPVKSTPADWQKAADKLNQQKSDGIVRQYYDQSYIHALNNGDTWISEAWSGDIFIANQNGHTNLKLVIPEEGAMFWTDNMLIPIYAKNPLDAMTYMDFVYDPTIQAMIEGYDAYVCPVPAAQAIMAASSDSYTQAAAKSPTVFPSAEIAALSRAYYNYKNDQELQQWNSIFQPIIQS